MNDENQGYNDATNNAGAVETTTVTEQVVEEPKTDEAGPLGNVTEAVTERPELGREPAPQETVVERETVVETPVEDPATEQSESGSDESQS